MAHSGRSSTANREEIKAIVARHHGRVVALLGSVARGEETPASDLDFLVDFNRAAVVVRLGAGSRWTSPDLLGREVDVVSSGGLLPEDDDVRQDAVRL